MTDMTVPQTILAQLGGNRFVAMTGASSFAGSSTMLTFRIPQRNRAKAAGVRIHLDADDTYTMEFIGSRGSFKKGNFAPVTVAKHDGVYCTDLQRIFTQVTGLDTHL